MVRPSSLRHFIFQAINFLPMSALRLVSHPIE
jgi:hypothetical protein